MLPATARSPKDEDMFNMSCRSTQPLLKMRWISRVCSGMLALNSGTLAISHGILKKCLLFVTYKVNTTGTSTNKTAYKYLPCLPGCACKYYILRSNQVKASKQDTKVREEAATDCWLPQHSDLCHHLRVLRPPLFFSLARRSPAALNPSAFH